MDIEWQQMDDTTPPSSPKSQKRIEKTLFSHLPSEIVERIVNLALETENPCHLVNVLLDDEEVARETLVFILSELFDAKFHGETADLRKEIKRRCDEMQLAQRESLERDAERHLRNFFYYRPDETEFDLEEAKEAVDYLLDHELDEWVRLEFSFTDLGDRINSFLRESTWPTAKSSDL